MDKEAVRKESKRIAQQNRRRMTTIEGPTRQVDENVFTTDVETPAKTRARREVASSPESNSNIRSPSTSLFGASLPPSSPAISEASISYILEWTSTRNAAIQAGVADGFKAVADGLSVLRQPENNTHVFSTNLLQARREVASSPESYSNIRSPSTSLFGASLPPFSPAISDASFSNFLESKSTENAAIRSAVADGFKAVADVISVHRQQDNNNHVLFCRALLATFSPAILEASFSNLLEWKSTENAAIRSAVSDGFKAVADVLSVLRQQENNNHVFFCRASLPTFSPAISLASLSNLLEWKSTENAAIRSAVSDGFSVLRQQENNNHAFSTNLFHPIYTAQLDAQQQQLFLEARSSPVRTNDDDEDSDSTVSL